MASQLRFGKSNSADAQSEMNDNTPHYHFIHSMLLPSTIKIQKELRGRRFKEVQLKLAEAVMGMQTFQFQSWPPQPSSPTNTTATSTTTGKRHALSLDEHLQRHASSASSNTTAYKASDDDIESESVVGDFVQATHDDDLRPFDDVSATTTTTTATSTATLSTEEGTMGHATTKGSTVTEDDPLTRVPMDKSITDALEAYIMVMAHEQKTNKACEEALSCVKQLALRNYISGRTGGRDDPTSTGSGAAHGTGGEAAANNNIKVTSSLLHRLMSGIQRCSESNTESVQSQSIEAFKEILINRQCSVHEASMLMAVRSIFHIYLVTKGQSVRASAKSALVEVVSNIILRMEEIAVKQRVANSLFHTDSYYLMRSLVKLSSKELPGIDDKSTTTTNFLAQQFFTFTAVDPLALNNKVLSLELILTAMECAGDALCNGERFIHLVQAQLCVALLKNCMSNNSQVAFISQRIFLILVYKFKAHLRDEIQLFMTNIYLRVLDSENSSFPQKALVLESLRSMCNDPQLLTQIFLNYDCDFDSMNLYKDIVFHLTKLSAKSNATSTANMSKKDAEEHVELSLASVEVLVTILQAFLNALGMPVSNLDSNDMAGDKIRKQLQLESLRKTKARELSIHQNGDEALTPVAAAPAKKEQPQSPVDRQEDQDKHNHQSSSSPKFKSSADVAGRIVDAFDRKRNAEQNFENGAIKFTLNLKDGINFFVDNGFVTLDARDIALFFLANKDKLDKTQMGEVLGREPDAAFIKKEGIDPDKGGPGFYVRILHHYVESMDFSGLMFDDAIRLFLSGFRLPGEAQKIDRIMEKFAERFTRQNLDVFPNADTAFILAFSVIMLNTDLHNPSIKPENRMTVEGFLRNNRGIGQNGTDLPEDFLRGVFNRIKERPFSLKEDDAAREKAIADSMQESFFGGEGGLLGFGLVGAATPGERKREKFQKEREELLSVTEELIRRRKRRGSTGGGRSFALAVAPADVVTPMFDVTWGPVLGVLSQVMEMSNDDRSIAVCLNGFVYSVRIAAHCNMSLARETFINSLTKFTLLGSIKEMKYKNIEAIRTLMKIAATDGQYLGESWGPVLQCISQLAKMRTAASGLAPDESFFEDTTTKSPKPVPSKSYFGQQAKPDETTKETEESNQRAVLEAVSEQIIDQVFSATVKLSAHCLANFMRQLVLVSTAEIAGETKKGITGVSASITGSTHGGEDGPSIFSLQKLVEVADYNMDVRPRLVWTQIWEILGDFFSKVGCHRNSMVSVFAIDSLKQLSSKFLEKPELSEFHFQRIFLRPFLLIHQNPATRQDIRELILECVAQIVDRKAHNLQSGWKIFFDIVMISASNESDKVILRAVNLLQKMLDEHLEKLTRLSEVNPELADISEMSAIEKRNRNSNAEDFIGMVKTSLSFVQMRDDESPTPLGVSMRALCHMAIYADLIADGRILPPVTGIQASDSKVFGYTYEGLEGQESREMALWRPIFEGLANGIRSPSRYRTGGIGCLMQRGSVLAVRSILLRHGTLFSKNQLFAILSQTVCPAIQEAAVMDQSLVIRITSESPAITSLDFLVEPMPLPPPRYDRGLLKFEEVARSVESAPSRPLGPAELLLEACFTDMRHGGDGDLTKAYKFAKKDMDNNAEGEQPFPDSWIATTGPVALGCLTDIASEIVLPHGAEGAVLLWPCLGEVYGRWCNGQRKIFNGLEVNGDWSPCEALMRIATREIIQFSTRLAEKLPTMSESDAEVWSTAFVTYFNDTLDQTLDMEDHVTIQLLKEKLLAYKMSKKVGGSAGSEGVNLVPILGTGETMDHMTPNVPATNEELPASSSEMTGGAVMEGLVDPLEWVKLVPVLKIRCVAAYFLHQALMPLRKTVFVSYLSEKMTTRLYKSLARSRKMAEQYLKNEDLAHAFQEAVLSEWGDDGEMGEEALVNIARLSQTQGSPMFFLTQTAGATQAMIWLLDALFESTTDSPCKHPWNREAFAAPHLLEIIKDVLQKFVESETREGHRIDPNVWRNSAESGVKVAIYCTSFASVVVELLHVLLGFSEQHMTLYGAEFYPTVCKLVTVQSDEIRQIVQRILLEKFGPVIVAATATGRISEEVPTNHNDSSMGNVPRTEANADVRSADQNLLGV